MTRFVAIGPEADRLFHNLCQAARLGVRKEIEHWAKALDVISKRQVAQLKRGVPLEKLS